MLGIRLDESTEKRLIKLCEKTGHTKTYFARKALKDFLDDREDYLLAAAELDNEEPHLTHDDIWKKLAH